MRKTRVGLVSFLFLASACTHKPVAPPDRHTQSAPLRTTTEAVGTASFPSEWNTVDSPGGPGIQSFQCEFPVPTAPVFRGQSIFLWCGVQQASGVAQRADFGVLQPVLMFGPDCIQDLPPGEKFGPGNDPSYEKSPYWYYSAQYVFPDVKSPKNPDGYTCTSGPVFKASPGEILVSTMTYDAAADAWTVQIGTRGNPTASSLTVEHPKNNPSKPWREFIGKNEILLVGALEIPHPDANTPVPPELLDGWLLKAKVTSLPQFPLAGTDAWKLEPNGDNALAVNCLHDPTTLRSDCTWRKSS